MTRDRFEAITKHLHFSDNTQAPADDRLWKVRPVVDTLGATFKTVFVPEQLVTVDESLWRYRGHHHAVQYNPKKRARFGLKVYKLCASDGPSAGYTCSFKIYMGKETKTIPAGLASHRAVTDLVEYAGLFDQGYELYTDNWYTSPTLFHYLQSRKTNAVGTVRTNRKAMPKPVMKVKETGKLEVQSSKTGMLALAWLDKRQVTMLSTIHTGEEWTPMEPDHEGNIKWKPKVVTDYSNGMKGVDLSDQMAVSYATRRKCKKWYHNLFWRLVDTTIVNALCVHKYLGGRVPHKDFRMDLLKSFLKARRRKGPREQVLPRDQHRLVRLPKRRRCQECVKSRRRKEPKWGCAICNIALCPGECFYAYHA